MHFWYCCEKKHFFFSFKKKFFLSPRCKKILKNYFLILSFEPRPRYSNRAREKGRQKMSKLIFDNKTDKVVWRQNPLNSFESTFYYDSLSCRSYLPSIYLSTFLAKKMMSNLLLRQVGMSWELFLCKLSEKCHSHKWHNDTYAHGKKFSVLFFPLKYFFSCNFYFNQKIFSAHVRLSSSISHNLWRISHS